MLQDEPIITNWAPALLLMSLDELLWKDREDIPVKTLGEYLSTYCCLPQLADYSVLENTIQRGLALDEFFGIAAGTANGRYVDLRFNKAVYTINKSDLLMKVSAALKQLVAEQQSGGGSVPGLGTQGGGQASGGRWHGGSGEGTGTGCVAQPSFFMSVKLDNTRVNRVVNTYVQEIVQHLLNVDGSEVELQLEVEVNAPDGIPASTVRTVSENCRTLKVKDFGFDD